MTKEEMLTQEIDGALMMLLGMQKLVGVYGSDAQSTTLISQLHDQLGEILKDNEESITAEISQRIIDRTKELADKNL